MFFLSGSASSRRRERERERERKKKERVAAAAAAQMVMAWKVTAAALAVMGGMLAIVDAQGMVVVVALLFFSSFWVGEKMNRGCGCERRRHP